MWEWRTIARSPTVRSGELRELPTEGWLKVPAVRSGPRSGSRDCPFPSSRMADGDEVQCPLKVFVSQSKVAGRDRRHEPVVEGLRHAQRRVDAVPAEPDRNLVH